MESVPCPVTNERCEHFIFQEDSNGEVAICHCTHSDNADECEGNCTVELCPLHGLPSRSKEFTLPILTPLPNLPPYNNPFQHDHFRMGAEVSGAWLAMFDKHAGIKQSHNLTVADKKRRADG